MYACMYVCMYIYMYIYINIYIYKYIYIYTQGENLNLVLTNDDVTVLIGDARCNVTSIADTQLTCRPPTPEPEALEHNPVVTVCNNDSILWLNVD